MVSAHLLWEKPDASHQSGSSVETSIERGIPPADMLSDTILEPAPPPSQAFMMMWTWRTVSQQPDDVLHFLGQQTE